jgi:SepF-like predicted cell division protein (DUF552 family)
MERVVFCPDNSDEMLDKAKNIAQEWMLPIQIGHSENTQNIVIDTSQPSILTIPINHYVEYSDKVSVGEIFSYNYVDDFSDVSDASATLLELTDDNFIVRDIGEMKKFSSSDHSFIIKHRFSKPGKYAIRVVRDGVELCNDVILITP